MSTSRCSPNEHIHSRALSVRDTHPDKFRVCILGACLTIPAIASSVILEEARSRIRRFSAV